MEEKKTGTRVALALREMLEPDRGVGAAPEAWAALAAACDWAKGAPRDEIRGVCEAYRDLTAAATGQMPSAAKAFELVTSGNAADSCRRQCQALAATQGRACGQMLREAAVQLAEKSGTAFTGRDAELDMQVERGQAAPAEKGQPAPAAPERGRAEKGARSVRVKDPEAPQSAAQARLIVALERGGVVSAEEVASLGDAPTKGAASALIDAASNREGFAEARAAMRSERAKEAAERRAAARPAAENGEDPKKEAAASRRGAGTAGRRRSVPLRFPAGCAHVYHTRPNADGVVYDKAVMNLPAGTEVAGRDLTGFSMDTFLRGSALERAKAGQSVVVNVPEDRQVEVFKGKGEAREALAVEPWDLTRALRAVRDRDEGPRREQAREAEPVRAARPREGREGLAEMAAEKREEADTPGPGRGSAQER